MRRKALVYGVALSVLFGSNLCAAELKLLAPLAVTGILRRLIPDFEKDTDAKVNVTTATLPQVAQKAASGESFDVVIAPAATIDKLHAAGLASGVAKPFGVAHISIAYRKGAPAPKASTLDEVREMIKQASTIGTTGGGTTAVYFGSIAKQLGLEAEVKRKTVLGPSGRGALPVAQGKAEIGVSQSSEIADLRDVDSVRLLPADPRSRTPFVVSVLAASRDQDLARRFVDHLVSAATEKQRMEAGFSMD